MHEGCIFDNQQWEPVRQIHLFSPVDSYDLCKQREDI